MKLRSNIRYPKDGEDPHLFFMEAAYNEALKCLTYGDVPVGAVVVKNGRIIGKGHNRIERKGNPHQHAEMRAIKKAVRKIRYKHLIGCDLYVTLEPCSMCAGAIILARIRRVIIGAADPKTGAAGSLFNILQDERLNHRCEVITGVLGEDCSNLLKQFFKELRKNNSFEN